MKKSIIVAISILFAFILLLLFVIINRDKIKETFLNKQINKSYYYILKELIDCYGETKDISINPGVNYAELIDFNNDGIKELFVIYTKKPYEYYINIFSYDENSHEVKIKYSKNFNSGGFAYLENINFLYLDNIVLININELQTDAGYIEGNYTIQEYLFDKYYQFKNNSFEELKLSRIKHIICDDLFNETTYLIEYELNKNPIEEELYNTYMQQYNKGFLKNIIINNGSAYLAEDFESPKEVLRKLK